MLRKTVVRTRNIFGAFLFIIVGATVWYTYNQPATISPNKKFLDNISLLKTHDGKNLQFIINWNEKLKTSSAEDKNNYLIEQVKQDGKNWVIPPNSKKCTIQSAQYVYSPWLDTQEKRIKANNPDANKVTQLSVIVEPREEMNDYYRVSVKNMENTSDEKMTESEYSIVKLTQFNNLIKR